MSTKNTTVAASSQADYDKFMKETSGGFHSTDADWTKVGMDATGFPVPKGSLADISEKDGPKPERKAGTSPSLTEDGTVIQQGKELGGPGAPNGEQPKPAEPAKQPEQVAITPTGPGQPDGFTKTVATPGPDPATGSGDMGIGTGPTQFTGNRPAHLESADEAAGNSKETVTMTFPRPVTLTVDHSRQIKYEAGLNEVPKELADHQYLKNCGVVKYEPKKPAAPEVPKTQAGDPSKGAIK